MAGGGRGNWPHFSPIVSHFYTGAGTYLKHFDFPWIINNNSFDKRDRLKLKLLFLIQQNFNLVLSIQRKIDAVDLTISMSVIYFSLITQGQQGAGLKETMSNNFNFSLSLSDEV